MAAVLNEQVLKEGIKSRAQVGNGNCMVLLTIPETPAIEEDNIFTQSLPQVSTTTNVDGDTVVAVSITFSWREPDLSYDNVSQYHIWFNTEPLPTGEGSSADIIPMISKRQATMSPNVSDSRITVVSVSWITFVVKECLCYYPPNTQVSTSDSGLLCLPFYMSVYEWGAGWLP